MNLLFQGGISLFAQSTSTSAPASGPISLVKVDEVVDRLGATFADTPWSGWLILALSIMAGLASGRAVRMAFNLISRRLHAKNADVRAICVDAAAAPAALALTTLGLQVGLHALALNSDLVSLRTGTILLLYTVALGWFLYNLVDLLEIWLHRLSRRSDSVVVDQIVPLLARTARLFILVIFVLFAAQNVFGADITAWLAGLGIAGLAVSLAAQDSVKNLFGSVTIFLDSAYAVGDQIILDGQDGMVEEIGFRSTKLRTLEGHQVTIPNSKVVGGNVINISRRQNIRRVINVALKRALTADKLEQTAKAVQELFSDPEISSVFDQEKYPPRVVVSDLDGDCVNLQVYYWYQPADQWQFLEHAQKLNLKLMRVLEKMGA